MAKMFSKWLKRAPSFTKPKHLRAVVDQLLDGEAGAPGGDELTDDEPQPFALDVATMQKLCSVAR